jgi:hypothetical protein
MRVIGLSVLVAAIGCGQSSPEVMKLLRTLGETLTTAHEGVSGNGVPDAGPFLEQFDSNMPKFSEFREEIQTLVARAEVGAAIEVVSDEGDDQKRELKLDWVLEIEDQRPRRQLVDCTIELEKRKWRITKIEPIEFFKY